MHSGKNMNELQLNLQRIKELTEQLDLLAVAKIEYDCPQGRCFGYYVLKDNDVAVQDVYLEPNTLFPKHRHNETEVLVLVEGDITDKEILYNHKGDVIIIKSDTTYTTNGCRVIAINLEGHPNGQ